jgi:hypothetical protein
MSFAPRTAAMRPGTVKMHLVPNKLRQYTYVASCILIVSVSVLYMVGGPFWHPSEVNQIRPQTAAIVDQLSGTIPNPVFTQDATAKLVRAGFKVDYFPPDQVTVGLLKQLPSMGYGVVIFRNHSTGWSGDVIAILTSEPYSADKYLNEQLNGQLIRARLGVAARDYFAVTPKFVREVMQGNFQSTIVVMMGCTGLVNSEMAQAFVAKGAKAYVSWEQVVLAWRTDEATVALLQSLVSGKPLGVAVATATDNVPPDPLYNSQLGYYPVDQSALLLNNGF